jgi:hypothetical protein
MERSRENAWRYIYGCNSGLPHLFRGHLFRGHPTLLYQGIPGGSKGGTCAGLATDGRRNGVALRPVVHTVHDLGFRISAVFAFEGEPIMARNLRLDASHHHRGAALWARRSRNCSGRCMREIWHGALLSGGSTGNSLSHRRPRLEPWPVISYRCASVGRIANPICSDTDHAKSGRWRSIPSAEALTGDRVTE